MNTAHQIEELRERGTFTITEHHDGLGLNDNIQVIASNGKRSTDPTGIPHAFEFHRFFSEEESRRGVDIHSTRGAQFTIAAEIQFQEGPPLDPSSTPGVTSDAVIACLLAFLRPANVRFPSRETAMMITKLGRLHKRIRDLEFRTEYLEQLEAQVAAHEASKAAEVRNPHF